MKEVERYAVIETALCFGNYLLDGEVSMVSASDYDAALAREAALREELAKVELNLSQSDFNYDADRLQMRQRLTAAEQRNAVLVGLLRDTKTVLGNELSYELFHKIKLHMDRIDAALKPTESGASE